MVTIRRLGERRFEFDASKVNSSAPPGAGVFPSVSRVRLGKPIPVLVRNASDLKRQLGRVLPDESAIHGRKPFKP